MGAIRIVDTLSDMQGNVSDTQHGTRGGGALHTSATTSAAGFMSPVDKEKLDATAEDTRVDIDLVVFFENKLL
ncbi:MAG: hypothetical protein MSG64_15715 [Pyrinomonadaceae bacterium MAG19_C2-C3]|nr:hypothetical protein [Pyrinomonadaceae bacterium MAG19_C2-C3]